MRERDNGDRRPRPPAVSTAQSFPKHAGCGGILTLSGSRFGEPHFEHSPGDRATREGSMTSPCQWRAGSNKCAMSASNQVADFECASRLENVHADSSALFRALRRSLLASPGRSEPVAEVDHVESCRTAAIQRPRKEP